MVASAPSAPQCAPVPVLRLWAAVLAGYLALGATLQELPIWLQSRFHAGPAEVGVLVGLAFAGTALGRPFAGRAGDTGRSREVALFGAALTAMAGLATAHATDVGLMVIARLLMGVGEAALFSATLPWVLQVSETARSGRVAGWFGLSMWGGLALGPLVAVAAGSIAGTDRAVWWVVIALPLVAFAILSTTTSESSPSPPDRPRGRSAVAVAGSSLVHTGTPGIVLGLAAYGYGSLTALLVLYLAGPGLGGKSAGLAIFAGVFLFTRGAGSSLVDRLGGRRVARSVLVIQAVGLIVLAEAHSSPVALSGVAITGLGLGLIYPATTKMTLVRADPDEAGAAVGAMTSMWDAGILAAGLLSGTLATWLGFRSAYLLAAALAFVAFAITALVGESASGCHMIDSSLVPGQTERGG